jgi:quercetin dioxygenase-like cupin family protein
VSHFPPLLRSLPRFPGTLDAFSIRAPGVEVLLVSYPPLTNIAPHCHDTENVGVVTQGELLLMLDGTEQRIGTGEWYHIPARALHAARTEVATATIEFWCATDCAATPTSALSSAAVA